MPMTRSGLKLHLIPDEASVALVEAGTLLEVSEHIPGRVWVAFKPGDIELLFDPDELDQKSNATLRLNVSGRRVCRAGVFIGSDLAGYIGGDGLHVIYPRDRFRVSWDLTAELMA